MSDFNPIDTNERSQEHAIKELKARLLRENEEADVVWLMSSRQGRRIVWRLLDAAGVFRLSFNTDALVMAFSEGNRNAGLKLLGQINALCTNEYTQMVREANELND